MGSVVWPTDSVTVSELFLPPIAGKGLSFRTSPEGCKDPTKAMQVNSTTKDSFKVQEGSYFLLDSRSFEGVFSTTPSRHLKTF